MGERDHDSVARANEQGIGEVAAETGECLAQRGLTQAQHDGRMGQVALAQQHLERTQLPQVDFHDYSHWLSRV